MGIRTYKGMKTTKADAIVGLTSILSWGGMLVSALYYLPWAWKLIFLANYVYFSYTVKYYVHLDRKSVV